MTIDMTALYFIKSQNAPDFTQNIYAYLQKWKTFFSQYWLNKACLNVSHPWP